MVIPLRVQLYILPESDSRVSVLWSGNTYTFFKALDAANVRGVYFDKENEGKPTYYRYLKDVDVQSEPDMITSIIKDVFHNLAMKVVVNSDPVKGSIVAERL